MHSACLACANVTAHANVAGGGPWPGSCTAKNRGQPNEDQTLTKGNLALAKSYSLRRPLRVIRGSKAKSIYAPQIGYRYDGTLDPSCKRWIVFGSRRDSIAMKCIFTGLYHVTDIHQGHRSSYHLIYRFVLNRCREQPKAAWMKSSLSSAERPAKCSMCRHWKITPAT